MSEEQYDNVTAYPLQWPEGWKRSPVQEHSRFSRKSGQWSRRDVTIAEATRFVLEELGRMGIPEYAVIISSNLELRLDGLPRSNQRAPSRVSLEIEELRAFRDIGEQFDYLGITCHVTGHYVVVPDLLHPFRVPVLRADYVNKLGEVKEIRFSLAGVRRIAEAEAAQQ